MITLIVLAPILLGLFLLRRVFRLFRPYGRHYNPYGYNRAAGFGFGRRRRHRFGGGLLTILGLVALDQLFTNRRP